LTSRAQSRERSSRSASQRIYFLRHGPAGQRSKWHGNDADRPLSERGRTQVRRVSRALERAGIQPDRIVTSPFARATQTADIASETFGLPQFPTIEPLFQPGYPIDQVLVALHSHIELGTVLIVGHEPSLGYLISSLCGGRHPPLHKAGVAEVFIDQTEKRNARLRWVVNPEDVVKLKHGQLPRGKR
jgi:phosphohistidine phosphatase